MDLQQEPPPESTETNTFLCTATIAYAESQGYMPNAFMVLSSYLDLLQDSRVTNTFCQLMPPEKMQLISVTILQLTEVRTDTEPCQAAEAGPTVHGLIEFLKKDCCVLLLKLFVSHGFIAPISNT